MANLWDTAGAAPQQCPRIGTELAQEGAADTVRSCRPRNHDVDDGDVASPRAADEEDEDEAPEDERPVATVAATRTAPPVP